MSCPQEKELNNFGIYTPLFIEIENILLTNRTRYLSYYQLLNHVNPILRVKISNMLNTIIARNTARGKIIRGGFYVEESFIGVVASKIQNSNIHVVRNNGFCSIAQKNLVHFCWI